MRRSHRQGDCYHTNPTRKINILLSLFKDSYYPAGIKTAREWSSYSRDLRPDAAAAPRGAEIDREKYILRAKFKRKKKTYRSFILIRLVEGEPQVETRLPCLHQLGTSNALIDGSKKNPCHLTREKERDKVVPPTHTKQL